MSVAAETNEGALARKIMAHARNTLMINMRFLDMALYRLMLTPSEQSAFATDGRHIYFNYRTVIGAYKSEPSNLARSYFHMVLHCIFRHPFISPLIDQTAWDFACDVAVEHAINELGLESLNCGRQSHQTAVIKKLKEVKTLTAERIYRYLLDNPQKAAALYSDAPQFFADTHDPWYIVNISISLRSGSVTGATGASIGDTDSSAAGATVAAGANADGSVLPYSHAASRRDEMIAEWKEIADRLQLDLETFSKQQGNKAGALSQNILEVNREKYDYGTFLKRFAVMGEEIQVNDEEFDYIFYTYGMKLYEKMPLIEPLEYKDIIRIKEFVIAIDTSGSVAGEEVQSFLQKTYNILKQTESFFSKINLHIIQCDAEIQDITTISTPEDIEVYIETKKLKGFGGTDFRPVFRYVDKAIERGEFSNLRGLIYFTDGYGTFPEQPTGYNTAFVFVEDPRGEILTPEVPVWAIKLVLRSDET